MVRRASTRLAHKVVRMDSPSLNSPHQDSSASERHLRAILDTAVDGIVVADEQGTIETFNRAAQRMFEYTAAEVVGKNLTILMPEPYRSAHAGYLRNYLETGQAKIIGIGREALGMTKSGRVFPIELAVSEVQADGRRTFAGIIRDISERKKLEREILEASEREQQKIGHDLHDGICQELAGIAFLVQSMQQKMESGHACTPEQAKRITDLLQDAVRHTRSLSHSLRPVEAAPNGLAVALQQLADTSADIHSIHCTFKCAKPVDLKNAVVATHLYRIAQEAVRDAIRHGKATSIQIELIRGADHTELRITDNGLGLAEDGRMRADKVLWMIEHRARVISARIRVHQLANNVRFTCEIPDSALTAPAAQLSH